MFTLYPTNGAPYGRRMGKVDDPNTPGVDARKTRRALAKVRRVIEAAEHTGRPLSAWETEFAESVQERLETFGSAFIDPAKGARDEPLSTLQAAKLREIASTSRKAQRQARAAAQQTSDGEHDNALGSAARRSARRPGKGFQARRPQSAQRVRDVMDDMPDAAASEGDAGAGRAVDGQANMPDQRSGAPSAHTSRVRLRVIEGGAPRPAARRKEPDTA